MKYKDKINLNTLPRHIAIIMDGNGRWAKKQGLLRVAGHQKGTNAVRDVVEGCAEIGIGQLTLYAFSTENWKRPKVEVETLMKLLVSSLRKEIKTLQDNNIRLDAIGNLQNLPASVLKELEEVMDKTAGNTRMNLTLALSYGSRDELVQAMQQIGDKIQRNEISLKDIDESVINEHLYTRKIPDVDLLIRTSGEQRISNFLLWQIAYAELYFTEILWPDYRREHLFEAIYNYQNRERRFGKTSEQLG